MSIGFAVVDGVRENNGASNKRGLIGNWEVHSWGNSKLPGMAVVSAISTLQIGATLAEDSADRIAMNKAAEYLIDALAPQLQTFQRALASR